MTHTLENIFEYLDDLSGADLLPHKESNEVRRATKIAKESIQRLKGIIEKLDGADLLPIPEEEEGFPSGEEIIDFFKFSS
jgi:hypothetical protein